MIIVVVERVAIVVMPMPVGARLGRTGDRKRSHRKHGNRSQNRSCLFHSRSFKKGTEPSQRYTSAIVSTRGDSVRLRCGVDVTVSRRARQAVSRQERRQSESGLQQADGRDVEPIFPENASLLTEREILPQFERAQPKLSCGVRPRGRPDQRKRRIRELLPDRQILRGNREPTEPEHVSARFGHSAGLLPCDFIDQSFFPSEVSKFSL